MTRALAEREPSLSQLYNDTLKMQKAFSRLRNKIGVIVPFERCIRIFNNYFDAGVKKRLGITCDDEVFVGTPDMFRGVEKDIIIVAPLRNSTVCGIGQFSSADFVKLAVSRSKHFLWVVGASSTLIDQDSNGAQRWMKFVRSC